ncbi:MAG: flagellar motor switch protein FliN [Planctomycetes bacterium]|nr:flagellar motor switch protein FliN [Planctomycetota bacterium]
MSDGQSSAPVAEPAPLPMNDLGGSTISAQIAPSTPDDSSEYGGLKLLDDVELEVKIELGRTQMYIEDVLQLGIGSVVELDKLAGDPVDVYVNNRLVARGEVLVLNENLCVRINEIVSSVPETEAAR